MTSTTAISAIVIEPETTNPSNSNGKEKFAKRFKSTNIKQDNQSKNRKQSPSSGTAVQPLQADDIQDHRLWSLASLVLCFFLIAPIVAFYHSKRIRKLKANQELTRAKVFSDRVNNTLIFSNIIGAVVWVAIVFVIAVLFVLGAVY